MSQAEGAGSRSFQVLDHRSTDLGDLLLRRRDVLSLGGRPVWEITLDGRLLMSSLVNDSERALAHLGLDELGGRPCSVLVGGLGLGATAREVLSRPEVRRLVVIELLEPVLDWHRRGLVPDSEKLQDDQRCKLRLGDFFAAMAATPTERWDAILLDIDHSPGVLLRGSPAEFYRRSGLQRLAEHLAPDGVFALWSADPADQDFLTELCAVFTEVRACDLVFDNPMFDTPDHNVVYVARRRPPTKMAPANAAPLDT